MDAWIAHMQWQHDLAWSCQEPRHAHLRFNTSGKFEAHMQQEHSEDFSAAQLALLVKKSAHPAADPLAKLIRSKSVDAQERCMCPFCEFAVEGGRVPDPLGLVPDASVGIDGMKQMRHHIAGHLESIALLSLPERDEIDNAASNELQSESAKVSSRGADPDRQALWQTSDAWNEYNLIRWNEEALLENPEYMRDSMPLGEDEDWAFYYTAKALAHTPSHNPGQDPVLLPFVERARRVQMLELQRRLGIPLLVVTDPSGLEVPEGEWSTKADQVMLPTPIASIHEVELEPVKAPDSLPSGRDTAVEDLPTFAVTEH